MFFYWKKLAPLLPYLRSSCKGFSHLGDENPKFLPAFSLDSGSFARDPNMKRLVGIWKGFVFFALTIACPSLGWKPTKKLFKSWLKMFIFKVLQLVSSHVLEPVSKTQWYLKGFCWNVFSKFPSWPHFAFFYRSSPANQTLRTWNVPLHGKNCSLWAVFLANAWPEMQKDYKIYLPAENLIYHMVTLADLIVNCAEAWQQVH